MEHHRPLWPAEPFSVNQVSESQAAWLGRQEPEVTVKDQGL